MSLSLSLCIYIYIHKINTDCFRPCWPPVRPWAGAAAAAGGAGGEEAVV